MNDTPIRSGWNEALMILKGPLTDRAIERYQQRGYYSQEMKDARRAKQQKKLARRGFRREGNFLVGRDGERVYSPA
jgi:SOS response regulatory protein OraA/RecX